MPSMSPSTASRTWSSGRRPPGSINPSPYTRVGGRPMRRVISLLGVVALMLFAIGSAGAQDLVPCDFLTGGGYIITTASGSPAHGNFGVGGSCKQGGDGHGLWGHLEYHDHGTGLNVHWLTITGYFFCTDPACASPISPVPQIELGLPGTRL